jgi:DNA-binding response OmpR family regulator
MKERQPSLVIVDLQTGSAGGFALSHDMDATERLGSIPVLMLLDREQDGWLAHQAGADSYMVKPVEAGTIVARVRELLAR